MGLVWDIPQAAQELLAAPLGAGMHLGAAVPP